MLKIKTERLICTLHLLAIFSFILPLQHVTGQKTFFRNVKVPDEIQQTTITCLYQDKNSYMWIGTGKGFYRFNGVEYTFYPGYQKEAALPVSALFMTSDQVLWIGTRNGDIYRLIADSLQQFAPEEGNPQAAITGFATDKSGNLWFSTYGEGLYYYDGRHIYNLNTDDGLTSDYCYTLNGDDRGRIWTATDGGISICKIEKGKKNISTITNSQGLPDNIVLSFAADGKYMWVGMQDAGVCSVDLQSFDIHVPEASENWLNGPVDNLVAGRNWLWLSSERSGIFSMETSTGKLIGKYTGTDNSIFSRINRLLADNQGNYWISSGNQLYLSAGNDLIHYSMSKEGKDLNIHSILTDSRGNLWFSNDEGLFRMKLTDGKPVKINLPIKTHTHFISIYEDENGYIWAGTFGLGLFCIHPDGKNSKLFAEAEGLSNGNILSITGKGRQIWLATLGGAYKCDITDNPLAGGQNVTFTNYGEQHFPGNNYIYSVFIDSQNRIWFATDGKGISMLEKGRFTNFGKEQNLKSNIIYSIAEDSDGDIWFSTSDAGIYRYNGKNLLNYSVTQGLSNLQITGLLADKNHHLLIIHNNGVDIMDTRNNTFYYCSAGLGMSDINPDLNVASLAGENVAWLGTQKGIIRLQIPEDLSVRQPSLQLDRVSVFLEKENYIGTHVFSYNRNHISFHFNSLWYIAPNLVKYQIRLRGYNLDWIETRDNLVTYSSLPPGKYTFEVRTSVNGDFSHSEIRSYSFTIKKPIWKTYWFIIGTTVILAFLLYLFIRFREKALKKRDADEREKLMFQFQTLRSQVNPHFLFNSFSTLISIIDEDKDTAIEYVEKLSRFFRDILDYRDIDIIPLSDELKLIDTYFYLQKKRYCDNLKLEIEIGEEELKSLIPPMVLQMLVENAIKHNVVSAEMPLNVRITSQINHIIVSNNLQPKKAGLPSTGIGLTNIRSRYNLLGFGEVQIEKNSQDFIVKLPLIYR